MSGRRTEVERGLALLRESVVDRLSAQGWTGRDLTDDSPAAMQRTVATVTRTGANGVLVAVEIVRSSFNWPPRWPVEIAARMGVGYEPALNLMPLLTLPPRAILVHDHAGGGGTSRPVSLTGPGDVVPAAEQIVGWVRQRAAGLASRFADAAAIDAELERWLSAEPAKLERARSDGGPKERRVGVPDRLALLAAMGRHEQARTLLAGYEAEAGDRSAEGRPGSADRRFVRQLRRWLDQGSPPAPPVEDTLAILARPPREPRPARGQVLAAVRAKRKVENEARQATRAHATGKNIDQLKALVATEYGARGIDLPPFAVAWYAEMLQIEQHRPFGRVRARLKGLRIGAAGGKDFIRTIRGRVPTDPDWLRPPPRASYPVRTDRTHYVPVELDPAARAWMDRVQADAPRRLGPWTLIDAWLNRDQQTGQLTVHIGEHRVGTIHPDDTHRFDRVMTAAALFDEDPVVDAHISPADIADSTPLLEVAIHRAPQTPERPAH
jgi:hypothetical protein